LPLRYGTHVEGRTRRRTATLLRRRHPSASAPPRVRPTAVPLPPTRSRRRSHPGPTEPVPVRRRHGVFRRRSCVASRHATRHGDRCRHSRRNGTRRALELVVAQLLTAHTVTIASATTPVRGLVMRPNGVRQAWAAGR